MVDWNDENWMSGSREGHGRGKLGLVADAWQSSKLMPVCSRDENSSCEQLSAYSAGRQRIRALDRKKAVPVTEWAVGKLTLQMGRAAGEQALEVDPLQPHLQQQRKASHLLCFPQGSCFICSPKPLSILVSLSVLFLTFTCLIRSKFSWEIFEKHRWSMLARSPGVPRILAGALDMLQAKREKLFVSLSALKLVASSSCTCIFWNFGEQGNWVWSAGLP